MGSADSPIVLFDGVCNLCHAAVQWLIERDGKGVFRFASLQSEAGRALLRGVGELPDSVVLVDEEGVHTRSEAALRIAKRLGFPYSLAVLGSLMPRLLRDGIYGWIARNRYGWFGRRDACRVPTAELAWRFLDAGEKIEMPVMAAAVPEKEGWLARWIWLYILLTLIPNPVDFVCLPLYEWLAKDVLGFSTSRYFGSSFKETTQFVGAGFKLLFALIGGLVWRWRLPEWFDGLIYVVVRYFLGLMMLLFGWAKLIPIQFELPGPAERLLPLVGVDPMQALWRTYGASPAHEMFLGAVEVIVGLLLLFPASALIGAMGCAVVSMQVMVLNYCYNIPVKLNSTHLFLFSCYLVLPQLPRVLSFLVFEVAAPPPAVRRLHLPGKLWPKAGLALRIVVLAGMMGAFPVYCFIQWREVSEARKNAVFHGYYFLDSNDEAANPFQWARVAFSSDRRFTVLGRSGAFSSGNLLHDRKAMTVAFELGNGSRMLFRYKLVSPKLLELETKSKKMVLKRETYLD